MMSAKTRGLLGVLEDASQRVSRSGFERRVDFFGIHFAFEFGGKVGQRTVGGWHADGQAVELTIELG